MGEILKSTVRVSLAFLLSLGAVSSGTACGRPSRAPTAKEIQNASLEERFGFDYLDHPLNREVFPHDDCLKGKFYDTRNDYATYAIGKDGNTITITPNNKEQKPLVLIDAGAASPLQPGNDTARSILEQYHCETGAYDFSQDPLIQH